VISAKTGVITEETPVIDGNNYTKGKGKGKEIKKEKIKKENLAIKNLKHAKGYGTKPQQPSSANEDAERQAEPDRMREAVTANK
ncbi:MAG: hypothetical protein LBS04_04145, partial [Tannerellaceae bacterium]|nr:hypothetical protein [Tannerellaceae bacterium]